MATETLSFDILARDLASPSFKNMGRAASDASGNLRTLSERLDKVAGKTAAARVKLDGDKEAEQKLDRLGERILRLSGRKVDPEVDLAGYLRTRAQITKLDLELDRLNAKRTRIHLAIDKAAGLGFLQPSALGTAVALLPTLIPIAAQVTAGITAIAVSFAAAGAAAAGFGALAGTVLTQAAEDNKKLAALNQRLNTAQTQLADATTKAGKKSARDAVDAIKEQIKGLTSTWTPAYRQLQGNLEDLKNRWKHLAIVIATPALNTWLEALQRGLRFLKPALQPVADLFEGLGQSLNAELANNAGKVRELAAAFGRFSATQLADVVRFITGIAKGVFNLGKALADNGANFGAAGTWLAGIGDGFATWSKSDAARKDVQGFMKFLHDTGPTVKSILSDLRDVLPGIFAGVTTLGTLELKALSQFLHFLAGLPPGWQKGITEFAGAMLLLSKIGIVKVGLVFTGRLAALLFGGSGAAGTIGAAAAGALGVSLGTALGAGIVAGVAGVGVAAKIRSDLAKGIRGLATDLAPDVSKLFTGLGGIFQVGAEGLAGIIVNRFTKPVRKLWGEFGRDIVASAKADWHDVASSFDAFRHTMASSFDAFRHAIAHVFDVVRHTVASAWDTTWDNTVGRARNGVNDVLHWIGSLPGKIRGFFFGASHWLTSFGRNVIQGFWDGMSVIWHKVTGWISSLAGWIRAHKGPIAFDRNLLRPAGEALMKGLHLGLLSGFGPISNFIGGLAGTIGGLISKGISSLFGGAPGGASHRSLPYLEHLWVAAGGPRGVAHLMAAIAMAESGGNPRAFNPSGASGLWQILGLPFPGNPFDPFTNARMAVAKYRSQGLGAWEAYTNGMYRAFYASGTGASGAAPGWAWVGEKGPELVRFSGGETVLPHTQSMNLAGYAKGTGETLHEHIERALSVIRRHPGLPDLFHRLHVRLAAIISRITDDRQLIRRGDLHGARLERARRVLRNEEDHRDWVEHRLVPLTHRHHIVARAAELLAVRDRHLEDALQAAHRRHMTRAAAGLEHRLTINKGIAHRLNAWLDKVQIEQERHQRQLQRERAARLAAQQKREAIAENNATIRSYIGLYGAGWSAQAKTAAAAALGASRAVVFDRGGWLQPGVTVAVNQTGHPEMIVPRAAGYGGGNTYNITVSVPPNANLAEAGRVTVEAIRQYEKRSGSGWRR